MLKLTLRDKIILIVIVSVLCFWGEYKLILCPMRQSVSELNKQKIEAKALMTDVTPLMAKAERVKSEKDKLKEKMEDIKCTYSEKAIRKEDFLVFIGKSTEKNNVYVTKYNNIGVTSENGVYKMYVDMELKGDTKNINKVITDIDSLGVKYSVGSMSYRQNVEYDYLKRFYDDLTDLPWYKEPEKKDDEQSDTETADDKEEEQIAEMPQYSPVPEKEPPKPVLPYEEQPKTVSPPEEIPKSLEQRLEELLEPTVYNGRSIKGGIMLVANKKNTYIYAGDMRLAVTICIVMFDEPTGNLAYDSENDYGVL